MSDTRRVLGERVYCHQCSHEWDRAHGGITCPACGGEFVEILEPGTTSIANRSPSPPTREPTPPPPSNPFHNHNPWAHDDVPDPDEGDITTFEFNTGNGGRGTFSFTTRSYTTRGGNINFGRGFGSENDDDFTRPFGGRSNREPPIFGFTPFGFGSMPNNQNRQPGGGMFPRDPTVMPGPGNLQDLFSVIFQNAMQPGGLQQQQRRGNPGAMPPNPLELLGALFNPANARHGDAVWSQEAFDRILEQLAEQNAGSTAPGPASEDAIAALPAKTVDKEMLGSDGKGECTICMDDVEIGTNVTELPCKHWFHRDCVVAWLKEHDTCPHCRKPISDPADSNGRPTSSRRTSNRHRRPLSVSAASGVDGNRRYPDFPPDPRSAMREARQQYYGMSSNPELDRQRSPPNSNANNERSESNRADGNNQGNRDNNSGGVTGWIRNYMNLG